ncbi:MAG TPA: NAD(+)/NADH kinase [Pirellulales bacterium]|nr:NAD(+)/NADH kinase [Pirellulales bacterium]
MSRTEALNSTEAAVDRPRVIVLGYGDRAAIREQAERMRSVIAASADIVLWDLAFTESLAEVDADLVIVFGGDGSILRAAHQMAYRQLPVVAVNLGKLGFLADLSVERLLEVLPRICRGEYRVVEHLMFECTIEREGAVICQHLGLNEVGILAGAPFAILDIHLYADDELITTYSCDGLLISTPVGSTAHSLSAGGPILRKDLQAFLVLAISPHTLTNRPVIDCADRRFELVVPQPHEGSAVVVDGRAVHKLLAGDRVRVERAVPRFKLVEVPGHGYYRTLREKLGWGGQLHLNDH